MENRMKYIEIFNFLALHFISLDILWKKLHFVRHYNWPTVVVFVALVQAFHLLALVCCIEYCCTFTLMCKDFITYWKQIDSILKNLFDIDRII